MTQWLYIWGITIEAHNDDRNVLDYGVLSFGYFCIWLVTHVSRIFGIAILL